MSNVEVSKRVVFAGVWRSQSVNDQLLRQIGNQNSKKKKQIKGSPSVLNLSSERLDILIYDDKGDLERTDQVPLQDIVELSANKYAATSIFAIVRDNVNKQFYIFVFQCSSDNDAADIIQGYGKVKQRLSGEGFNTDIKPGGTNWLLQSKQEQEAEKTSNGHVSHIQLKPTQNGDVRILSADKQEGETRILVGGETKAEPMAGDHVSVSESEMKEELHHLAGELRDIKLMLNKSHGRHNFEKHYQYLIQGSGPGDNRAHFTEQVVVDGNKPTETEVKYRLGSTMARPGSQVHYRNTVVQPASHVQQYRTTVVQPSSQAQQYRTTVVQPASQVQRHRTTVIQPSSHAQHYKSATIQHAPQIQHFKSTRSTTSSVQSGYTKTVHDSINPALEMNRKYIKNQPRVVTVRKEIAVNQRNAPEALVFHSPSDKVTRRIEQVYKPRSYRMRAIPSARPTAEYVVIGDRPRNPGAVVQQTNDDKVKLYINEAPKEDYQTICEPPIRPTYENKEFVHEDISESNGSVQQPTVAVTEVTTEKSVHYEEHTTRDDNVAPTETVISQEEYNTKYNSNDDDVIVIKANTNAYTYADESENTTQNAYNYADERENTTQGLSTENENTYHVRYEPYTAGDATEAPIETATSHEQINVEHNAHDGDEIVVRANTDIYKSVDEGENTSPRQSAIISKDVYYVSAGNLGQFESVGNEGLQDLQGIAQENAAVIQSIPDPPGDGLFESYVDKIDENASRENIVSEIADRYHDGEENEDGAEDVDEKEVKHVHYMDELRSTFSSRKDDDHDDVEINKNDDDDDDDYTLNEEEMKQFILQKEVIVIDQSN